MLLGDTKVSSSTQRPQCPKYTGSSSSSHATSTDLSDPLSPPVSVFLCSQKLYQATPCSNLRRSLLRFSTRPNEWGTQWDQATPCIGTELTIGSSWSFYLCSSMWRTEEYIPYEIVLTYPAVSRMSSLFNFDSFRNGPYSCSYMRCCLWSFNTARTILVKLLSSFFSIRLVSVHVEKIVFYFIGLVWLPHDR